MIIIRRKLSVYTVLLCEANTMLVYMRLLEFRGISIDHYSLFSYRIVPFFWECYFSTYSNVAVNFNKIGGGI